MFLWSSFNINSIIKSFLNGLPQILPSIHLRQDAHLLDGDFVEPFEALGLRDSVVDHDGVDVLHVGDADKLVDRGIVTLVAFQRWIRGLPLLVRHAEKCDIQNICFTRIDDVHLCA